MAQAKLAEMVNEAKRTGVVQKAIERAGLTGVRVARLMLQVPEAVSTRSGDSFSLTLG